MNKTYEIPCSSPFPSSSIKNTRMWHGSFMNDLGLSDDFDEDDVDYVVWSYEDGDRECWDGDCAAIVKLTDGRYITWESFWGPTGSGFSADAYGGGSDVHITTDLMKAVEFGLSETTRQKALREGLFK